MGGWWRWALVSPAGVVPSRMVSVSASVNLPLHHKVQKFASGTGSPGWSRKKGHKQLCVLLTILGTEPWHTKAHHTLWTYTAKPLGLEIKLKLCKMSDFYDTVITVTCQ